MICISTHTYVRVVHFVFVSSENGLYSSFLTSQGRKRRHTDAGSVVLHVIKYETLL